MKFAVAFLLTALLSFAGTLFFPWWIIAVAAFIVAVVVPLRSIFAFLAAFFALFALWGFHSFYIDFENNHLLGAKVAHLLRLPGSYAAMILITAFVGGLVAGFAALTGSFLRRSAS